MIPISANVKVWIATGRTDMRKGMNSLALHVQQTLGRNPNAGDLFVFRGARGDKLKIIWHDGLGMSLYMKRLERGTFIWPAPFAGVISITPGRSSITCCRGSIGAIRSTRSARRWRDKTARSILAFLSAHAFCAESNQGAL